jgi:glucan phosphoethanolaminetransferase (alkaline phosphatase superfamily)
MKPINLGRDILNSFVNRWTLLSLFLSGLSLLIHLVIPSILDFSIITFTASSFLSLIIWNVVGSLTQLNPSKVKIVINVLIAFILPLLLAVGLNIYFEFKTFVDQNLISFVLDDPQYLLNVVEVFFSDFVRLLLFIPAAVILFFYLNRKVEKTLTKKILLIKMTVLLVILIIGQNQFREFGYTNFTSIDTSLLFTFKQYKKNQKDLINTKPLKPSNHRLTPASGLESKFNIVFVVQESMSVEPLSFYGYDNDYTPFLKNWINREQSNFILFQDAMAISGCTDISMPTMFTGVGPEEPYDKLMELPFLWDYAKANGYETSLISSQRYTWRNLRYFLKNESLDMMLTGEVSGLKVINDLGVDDIAISLKTKDYIVNRNKEKPLFLVYNSNALHRPYQNKSPFLKVPKGIKERYGKALYILDNSMKNIYDALSETGELDHTIFIFTSDHGDYTANRVQRLGSFLKETLQIPIFIRLPNSWIKENTGMIEKLQANLKARICNLDLVPTLIDLLKSNNGNENIISKLKGTSLFASINNKRMITCLSTNETRKWSNEGLGLYKDSLSYIIDNHHHEQLYDLMLDEKQENNIIESGPKDFLHICDTTIQGNVELKRIYENHAH